MIGDRVATRVALAQQHRQDLAGVRDRHHDRVQPEDVLLERRLRALLVRMRLDQRRVELRLARPRADAIVRATP